MENTTNYQLNKPAGTDYITPDPFNENADIIDAELKKAETHRGNSAIHVTAAQKAKWDGYGTVHTLTHAKTGTTHALTGLNGAAGVLSCQFKAAGAFAAGDTVKVDGAAYTVKLTNGETADDNLFVSGAVVPCIVDTAGKTVNFRAGGGGQLKKYASGNATITKTAVGKGSGTVSGLAFTPQVIVLFSSRLDEEAQAYIQEKDHGYWHIMGTTSTGAPKIDDTSNPFTITKSGFQLTDIALDSYYTSNVSIGGTITVPYWCYG